MTPVQRLCRCGNNVNDEAHFLVECGLYDEVRRKHGVATASVSQILNDSKFVVFVRELFKKRKEFVWTSMVNLVNIIVYELDVRYFKFSEILFTILIIYFWN